MSNKRSSSWKINPQSHTERALQVVIMTRLYSGGGVGLEYPETSVHVASDHVNRDTEASDDIVHLVAGRLYSWPCLTGKHWDNAFGGCV